MSLFALLGAEANVIKPEGAGGRVVGVDPEGDLRGSCRVIGGNGGPAAAAGEGKDHRRHPDAARIVALQHEDAASAVGTSPGGEVVSLAGCDGHNLAGRLPGAS